MGGTLPVQDWLNGRGGRDVRDAGVMGGDGDKVSSRGGGEQWPSRLRLARDGISAGLPKDMMRRRPEGSDGERRWCRGRRGAVVSGERIEGDGEETSGSLVAASANVAWWAAACCLARALAAAPGLGRRHRRRAGGEEVGSVADGSNAVSNLILVLPPWMMTDRVACPPPPQSCRRSQTA